MPRRKDKSMQDTDLSSIVEQLRQEERRLGTQQAELTVALTSLEADLKRVQGALSALGEKPATKSGRKAAATKKDVIQVISDVLHSQEVVENVALRRSVEVQLGEMGKSRQGLALRFEEALKDPRFVNTPAGYRLASGFQVEQGPTSEAHSIRTT
jgi:hypothetical protein